MRALTCPLAGTRASHDQVPLSHPWPFLLALAFVFLVYDGTKSIANQQFVYLRVNELWADIDQHSLNQVQDWFKAKALWAWDPYARPFSNCQAGLCLP